MKIIRIFLGPSSWNPRLHHILEKMKATYPPEKCSSLEGDKKQSSPTNIHPMQDINHNPPHHLGSHSPEPSTLPCYCLVTHKAWISDTTDVRQKPTATGWFLGPEIPKMPAINKTQTGDTEQRWNNAKRTVLAPRPKSSSIPCKVTYQAWT